MKLDLLTNATVVDDAIKFVSVFEKTNVAYTRNENEEDNTIVAAAPSVDTEEVEEQYKKFKKFKRVK